MTLTIHEKIITTEIHNYTFSEDDLAELNAIVDETIDEFGFDCPRSSITYDMVKKLWKNIPEDDYDTSLPAWINDCENDAAAFSLAEYIQDWLTGNLFSEDDEEQEYCNAEYIVEDDE